MSAIFGILQFDGGKVSRRDLERMANTLAHRGPHGRKSADLGAVGLGHCLLRVNDEDLFESQPIVDPDVALVADCRIDNREELAQTLGIGADRLRDMPDSAVVIQACRKWGKQAAEHLVGDFCFAMWDRKSRQLTLSRDHMGQRSLFYYRGEGFLVFATELRAIWTHPLAPRTLDEAAIARQLFPLGGDPLTEGRWMYKDICAIPGGCSVTVDASGEVTISRYWTAAGDPAHEGRDEAYYVETYRKVLTEAVACRTRRLSGSPALMLSGGFDSSIIAALAAPIARSRGRKLLTFSEVVSEQYEGSSHDIRRWVEACGRKMPDLDVRYLPHHRRSPLQDIEQRVLTNDGPAGPGDAGNHGIMAAAASAGASLVMDGVGGDYTVNPRGAGALVRLLRKGRYLSLFRSLRLQRRLSKQTRWQQIRLELINPLLPAAILKWLRPPVVAIDDYPINEAFYRREMSRSPAAAAPKSRTRSPTAMRQDMAQFARAGAAIPRITRAVAASSHGLEFTRPMHDKRVVEFGLAVPEDLYVKNGRNRYLACAAFSDSLPPELLLREQANDRMTPDIFDSIDLAMPELTLEIERLSQNKSLSAYIDFPKLQRLLSDAGPRMTPQTNRRRWFALRGLLLARYIEWDRSSNDHQSGAA